MEAECERDVVSCVLQKSKRNRDNSPLLFRTHPFHARGTRPTDVRRPGQIIVASTTLYGVQSVHIPRRQLELFDGERYFRRRNSVGLDHVCIRQMTEPGKDRRSSRSSMMKSNLDGGARHGNPILPSQPSVRGAAAFVALDTEECVITNARGPTCTGPPRWRRDRRPHRDPVRPSPMKTGGLGDGRWGTGKTSVLSLPGKGI